ncbi:alcohol dehydrogenase IV [Pisolithus microcarpus]|nr:alcohol dehydrogenase IV [Pisolithus microcarpus]
MVDSLHGAYAYHEALKAIYCGPGFLGGRKALIVTGKSLWEKFLESILKDRGALGRTFSQIGQHAPVQGIVDGIKAFEDVDADIFISVGGYGKSPTRNPGKALRSYSRPDHTQYTCSSLQCGAGYTDEQGNKASIANPMIAPYGIILVAELTMMTPEKLWLSTGLRALDHAVESLYRPGVAPPLKVLCYAAISDLFTNLPLSRAEPNSLDARQRLLIAAWTSLWLMRDEKHSPLGLPHSLGHKLGATYGIPHGVTSEDRAALAIVLFYLREPRTGTAVGDIMRQSSMINEYALHFGEHLILTVSQAG